MDQVSTFGQGELKKGNGDSRRALKVTAGRVKICYEASPSLSSTRSRQASTSNHRKVCVVDWDSLILRSDPNSPLAHGRPTNRGCTPDRVACLVPSQLVYPSACGLHSFMWLEFDVCTDRVGDRWGVVAWEFFTRPRVTCGALPESP